MRNDPLPERMHSAVFSISPNWLVVFVTSKYKMLNIILNTVASSVGLSV